MRIEKKCWTEEKCKKEIVDYCCRNMKKALNSEKGDRSYNYKYSCLTFKDGKITFMTHRNSDYGSIYMRMKYCPFCGTKI